MIIGKVNCVDEKTFNPFVYQLSDEYVLSKDIFKKDSEPQRVQTEIDAYTYFSNLKAAGIDVENNEVLRDFLSLLEVFKFLKEKNLFKDVRYEPAAIKEIYCVSPITSETLENVAAKHADKTIVLSCIVNVKAQTEFSIATNSKYLYYDLI